MIGKLIAGIEVNKQSWERPAPLAPRRTLFTYTSPNASEIRDGHGVAASAASLHISAREHSRTRQSVGDGAKKSKKWCVLVHFGASLDQERQKEANSAGESIKGCNIQKSSKMLHFVAFCCIALHETRRRVVFQTFGGDQQPAMGIEPLMGQSKEDAFQSGRRESNPHGVCTPTDFKSDGQTAANSRKHNSCNAL